MTTLLYAEFCLMETAADTPDPCPATAQHIIWNFAGPFFYAMATKIDAIYLLIDR
jgi:hypothetical protein